jgi:iron(III) transport system ATP-binding protein
MSVVARERSLTTDAAAPAQPAAVLEIDDLAVLYDETVAVRGAQLVVRAGELLALVGPSGCGKTTLLRAIAGFEVPRHGTITIGGVLAAGDGAWVPPERRCVGMVFQEGALFPHLSVRENVAFGVKDRAERARSAERALALVGLGALAERYPAELSGGEQQRVALARALAPAPRLILLDEPFANLDAGLRQRVRDEVRAILRAAGATAVLVTHDQEEALSFADRIAVMSGGEILQVGTPREIYERPRTLEVALFFGRGELIDCEVAAGVASTPFGVARCAGADGAGVLYVRAEDLEVEDATWDDGGRPESVGRIVDRRFFGHDSLDSIELADGRSIQVRQLAPARGELGELVAVALKDKLYRVFERPSREGS